MQALVAVQPYCDFSPTTLTYLQLTTLGTGPEEDEWFCNLDFVFLEIEDSALTLFSSASSCYVSVTSPCCEFSRATICLITRYSIWTKPQCNAMTRTKKQCMIIKSRTRTRTSIDKDKGQDQDKLNNKAFRKVHGGSEIVAARKSTFSGYPGVIYRLQKYDQM